MKTSILSIGPNLHWTPEFQAAQASQPGQPAGVYRLVISAGDGSAAVQHVVEVHVTNTNRAPVIASIPPQTVYEGELLNFVVRGLDVDGDPTVLSLVRDDSTPAGVHFDPATGLFEWIPAIDTVNALGADSATFNFTFRAADSALSSARTVQVRVMHVDHAPTITASSHALAVGRAFSMNVVKGLNPTVAGDLLVSDADGAAQTQALSVGFENLPEGASYDAQAGVVPGWRIRRHRTRN
jgi:hypothetical protein